LLLLRLVQRKIVHDLLTTAVVAVVVADSAVTVTSS
jgi:hypothetical protein